MMNAEGIGMNGNNLDVIRFLILHTYDQKKENCTVLISSRLLVSNNN